MNLWVMTRRDLLPLALLAGLSVWVLADHGLAEAADQEAKAPSISLTVDYGDGVQKVFSQLPWRKGLTVLQALESAKKHPRGITFVYKGTGSRGFLTQIDDLKNQGRGANWIYRVNNQLGDKSFAVFELQAGDAVLWKFGDYR